MTIRSYTRRSKADAGKQEYSLDVQDAGCREWSVVSPFAGEKIVPYVDDGIAGDDFLNRDDLRRLLAEAKPGDKVVCRDQSRLGRDAIEVTLAVREIVRERGCRLFYYVNGQEVFFETAMDAAMTFIAGTGHQMELEGLRSRVKESLQRRALAGRIAGGRCFGYQLQRVADGEGRGFTIAIIDHEQAEVVRRLFRLRSEGWGLKKIAHRFNTEGVPAPSAGKRGTGSWAPSCIRAMLMNSRYRGVYVHGRVKKVRKRGVVSRVPAAPKEVITVVLPEWQIIEDALWAAVQETFHTSEARRQCTRPRAKYALTGIARCGVCRGSVGVATARTNGSYRKSYACLKHHTRGDAVCPVTVYQPIEEIERALVAYLDRHVLTADAVESVSGEIRSIIEAQLPSREADAVKLEEELRQVKAEQRRLTKAVALTDDVPELVTELKERAMRARALEVRIGAIRRAPEELRRMIDQAEESVRERLGNVRAALLDGSELRQVFLRMFPEGIVFSPTRVGNRQLWKIAGEVAIGQLAAAPDDPWFNLDRDPKGT